jgi:hypothetical protein
MITARISDPKGSVILHIISTVLCTRVCILKGSSGIILGSKRVRVSEEQGEGKVVVSGKKNSTTPKGLGFRVKKIPLIPHIYCLVQ